MAGAVAAGKQAGGHDNFDQAIEGMTAVQDQRFTPEPDNARTYDKLYALYKRLHDAFGTKTAESSLYDVMKQLLAIRENVKL